MNWIRHLLKAERDFILQKRSKLLILLFVTFTAGVYAFLVIRAIRPNQRNIYSLGQVMWQSSFYQKLEMAKACVLLNFANAHVTRAEQNVARIYLEYDTDLNFLLMVMVSPCANKSIIMSVVDQRGILSSIAVYKAYGLVIY